MITKVAVVLAVLLAAAGVALRQEIQASGKLKAQIRQQEVYSQESAKTIGALRADIAARDDAIVALEVKRHELASRTEKVRTVVQKVYLQPDVKPWAETPPPAAVAAAVAAGLDCLWQSAGTATPKSCGDLTSGVADGRLPAPRSGHEQ